jgi:folate-binding protein YgfZ
MKAALLSDRGVVKVAGEDAEKFLNSLLTVDVGKVSPGNARFAALLTPQGKIIVDFFVAQAAASDGGGFFLDCPRGLAPTLVQRLNFYKLRAKVIAEDLSEILGVMAAWDGSASIGSGLSYADPRLPELGTRCMLPPHRAGTTAAEIGATLSAETDYEAHRIALGIPRGGIDFVYGDAFPHEADMDQLDGVDFDKGCFVGQEVVSRIEHRGIARTRVVPVVIGGAAPEPGTAVTASGIGLGTTGSAANGRGLAALRLDRVAEAMAKGDAIVAGGAELRPVKPAWARFAWPGEAPAANGTASN